MIKCRTETEDHRGKDYEINDKSKYSLSPDPHEDLGKHWAESLSLFLKFKYTAEEDALYEDEAPLDHTRNNEAKTQWKISIEKIKENYEAYEAKSNCSNNNNEVY